MLYNVIWGKGVVKNMTFLRYIIYGWPLSVLQYFWQLLVMNGKLVSVIHKLARIYRTLVRNSSSYTEIWTIECHMNDAAVNDNSQLVLLTDVKGIV